ncbi:MULTISPECIES: pectinesterase family protein [Glycomyces]|uniref:Pectinesterase n=2 Tax=Glycomyces TaxID=58113 RepID=A0A9X3ST13_9ACTN|nr:pectinesterase family protein [Glycomyces lechevalierae]MDA1383700.1 pectinesterase family protein [Glycomyces lechevalierae]MDR7341309.1 pectin methylesterase-like acyl-CoA thioesterase [Glycomyces lechevalierae]
MSTKTAERLRRRRPLAAMLAVVLGGVIAAAGSLIAATGAQAVETGVWYNLESRHSGLVMGIRAASTASGAELVQWASNGSQDQQFRFVDAGGGYYKIQVRHSGLVLDVAGASRDDGATVQQWGDGGTTNQQWKITESGGYATIVNRASGKALDVWEWSTAQGARISQYAPTGAVNQQWELVPAEGAIEADFVVAPDGSGTHTTVQAAVNAAPSGSTILVKKGTYKGNVTVPSSKTGITLVGETGNAADVVIHDNRCASCSNGNGGTWGTSGSASVLLQGANFTAEDLTFANTYDEAANGNSQAVAVKVQGDRMVFDNVRFLGNQDTLLTDSASATTVSRQYYHDCYVEGDVDFIFGRGTAVFDGCRIHSLNRGSTTNNGYIVAPSTEITNPYGMLFYQCELTSNAPSNSVYLGRPWPAGGSTTARGQVLYRQTVMGAHIRTAEPWSDMSGLAWEDARLREYQNTGPGATVNANRPQMSSGDAANYEPVDYLRGSDGWNPIR